MELEARNTTTAALGLFQPQDYTQDLAESAMYGQASTFSLYLYNIPPDRSFIDEDDGANFRLA